MDKRLDSSSVSMWYKSAMEVGILECSERSNYTFEHSVRLSPLGQRCSRTKYYVPGSRPDSGALLLVIPDNSSLPRSNQRRRAFAALRYIGG